MSPIARDGGRSALRSAALLFVLAGGASAQTGSAAVHAFCRDGVVDAAVAKAARDDLDAADLLALAKRLDDPSLPTAGCANRIAFCVGQKLALSSVDRAYGLLGAAAPAVADAHATLSEGRAHGSPWQLLVALGDVDAALAHQNHDAALYRDAAAELQRALNAINEPPLCADFGEVRPGPDDIRRIRKRAQEAVMLSPQFDVARTRSGECGGIFLAAVRGIEVEATPVPITFVFGKATFTPEGQKAADALLQCLKEKQLPAVTLTGHTDARGSDAYNMQLSAARLATVQAYLTSGGYAGALHLVPMGKREPFQPDDPTQHSDDELDQMNRRVELREVGP